MSHGFFVQDTPVLVYGSVPLPRMSMEKYDKAKRNEGASPEVCQGNSSNRSQSASPRDGFCCKAWAVLRLDRSGNGKQETGMVEAKLRGQKVGP